MPEGKPKTQPIEAVQITRRFGSVLIQLTEEDFIDIVSGKNLTVIGRKTPRRGVYYYAAFEGAIQYWVKTKRELTGLKVDIIVPKIRIERA